MNPQGARPTTPIIRTLLLGSGGYQGYAGLVLFMGIPLSIAVAYLIPDAPFQRWPWTKAFAELVAAWVPNVAQLVELSRMPQVTAVLMSILWVVWFPICTILLFGLFRVTEQSVLRGLNATQSRWWYLLLSPFIMAAIIWATFNVAYLLEGASSGSPLAWVVAAMGRSRFWLGFAGSIMVVIAAFAVVALLKTFVFMRLAYRVRKSTSLYRKL